MALVAVAIFAARVGAIFPFAQKVLTVAHAVVRRAPFAGIFFDGETFVGLLQAVFQFCFISSGEISIVAQNVGSIFGVLQELNHELLSMSYGIFRRTLFGRVFAGAFVSAIGSQLHALNPELRSTPHCGEGAEQEIAVERVAIVLPKVSGIPSVGDDIIVHETTYTAEDIVLSIASPTLRLAGILGILLPLTMIHSHVGDIIEERQVHLAQVGRFCWPVVHLHVDVRVNIRSPRWSVGVVPNTLQVAGQIHTA